MVQFPSLRQACLLGTLVAGLSSSLALASGSGRPTDRVAVDDQNLPRCIRPLEGENRVPVLLVWDEDEHFERQVIALPLRASNFDSTMGMGPRGQQSSSTPNLSCSNWQQLTRSARTKNGFVIDSKVEQIGSLRIEGLFAMALTQIREGASEFHPFTADEWLQKNPDLKWSAKTNRDLAKRFGVGFSSRVYRLLRAKDSLNANFENDVVAKSHQINDLGLSPLSKAFANHEIIYVKGLGHELASARRYDVMIDDFMDLGLDVHVVPTASLDPLASNAKKIQVAIEQAVQSGKRVILVSLSKGSAETLLALTHLSGRDEITSKVDAWLNVSGIVQGGFFMDWGSGLLNWIFVHKSLVDTYKAEGLELKTAEGFKELTTDNMARLLKQARLPEKLAVVNLVGDPPGHGLINDLDLRWIQDEIVRKRHLKVGSNDGYAESPNNEVPRSLNPSAVTLVLDSSHTLLDGSFHGVPLSRSQSRYEFLGGLWMTLSDRLNLKN